MPARTAVFSVIFPANIRFLPDFISSLNTQTLLDFELVLANDGVRDVKQFVQRLDFPFKILEVAGTPADIRWQGVKFLQNENYRYIVFADSDDILGPNRVEISRDLLETFPAISNELDLINEKAEVIEKNYWSLRLDNGFTFDHKFLQDQNIIGLGNSAIRSELLKYIFNYPQDVLAPDWYLFYNLLQKNSAAFTNQCKTLYRQHTANTIGLKQVTPERLRAIVNTKKLHYEALSAGGFDLNNQLKKTYSLEQKLKHPEAMAECLKLLNSRQINYFWWEETNYLI